MSQLALMVDIVYSLLNMKMDVASNKIPGLYQECCITANFRLLWISLVTRFFCYVEYIITQTWHKLHFMRWNSLGPWIVLRSGYSLSILQFNLSWNSHPCNTVHCDLCYYLCVYFFFINFSHVVIWIWWTVVLWDYLNLKEFSIS